MATKSDIRDLKPGKSELLDIQLISDAPGIQSITDILMEHFQSSNLSENELAKIRKALKAVVINTYRNWTYHKDTFTAYARDNNKYISVNNRVNPCRVNNNSLLKVIDTLLKTGILHELRGDRDKGLQSRIIADDHLIELFELYPTQLSEIVKHPDTPAIFLRDVNKNHIKFEEDSFTTQSLQLLKEYNRLLWSTNIEHPDKVLGHSFVYRMFKYDFEHGGRFYGGRWQYGIDSDERENIRINGNRTAELDYSGLHPSILYHEKGLALPSAPYTIPGFSNDERKLIKITTLAALNADSRSSAIGGIKRKIEKGEFKTNFPVERLDELFDQILRIHEPISEHFFTGVGLELQFKDSEITAQIIKHFTHRNILILPVHDSYVIDREHSDELERMMKTIYYETFGFVPNIDTKF